MQIQEIVRQKQKDLRLQQPSLPVCTPRTTPAEVNRCLATYGSREKFEMTFAPNKQQVYCVHPERCYFGNAPTLQTIALAYGENAPTAWMVIQLSELAEFCGSKDKLDTHQLDECAKIIASSVRFLKITELMLFFYRFKLGLYGKFYGAVDPLTITSALLEFRRERNNVYFRHENEMRQRQSKEDKVSAVSYEEYLNSLPEEERKKRMERVEKISK